MTFNSLQFAAFLPVAVALVWFTRDRARLAVVLCLSYFFYGAWNWKFLILIWASTAVDYSVARLMHSSESQTLRKRLLTASLSVNLGLLGIFKYFNFFVDSAVSLLENLGLSGAGDQYSLQVLLPVGISFYTFQTMSYTIDVYRGRIEPEQDLLTFAVFVAYFPQLVAGPIERAGDLLPRLKTRLGRPSNRRVVSGLVLIAEGLVRKVVLGDIAARVVDARFGSDDLTILGSVVAIVGFSLQIYGDFSGYSAIARGASRLIGVELSHNFSEPYLSRSITEFWRRWHISLSSWLRDYLYISLGGNRNGARKTSRNLMLTMLLGGLWHGAGWNFVIWGGLQGLYLMLERSRFRFTPGAGDPDKKLEFQDVTHIARTLIFVGIAWVFFRAETFGDAIEVFRGFGRLSFGGVTQDELRILAFSAFGTLLLDLARRRWADWVRDPSNKSQGARVQPVTAGVIFTCALTLVLFTSGGAAVPFIYFQF